MANMFSRGTNPKGAANRSENTTGKATSLSQHPPAIGAHKPTSVHVIPGGHNAGGNVIHPSLRKGK